MVDTPSDDSWGTSREGDEPVAGYRLERMLGRGNFGEVWRAKAAGVHCALKIVRLGGEYPEVGDREVRSLQLVKRLAHTRICQIQGIWIKDWRGTCLDIDNIDKGAIKLGRYQNTDASVVLDRQQPPILIVAMRLAQGSLYDLLKGYRAAGRRGIPRPELLGYMHDAARGLDYLHDPKDIDGVQLDAVVHCDIKPQNILKHLDEALIGDLGIARRWDRATGLTYKTEGVPNFLTPFYAAPELWSDRPVPATDQYALAITFYQCLTDRLPFTLTRDELRDRTQIMMAHVGGRLRFRKHLEAVEGLAPGQIDRLNDVFHQATLPDVTQRFPSCTAFVQAIEQALAEAPGGSAPVLPAGGAALGVGSGSGEHAPPAGSGSAPVATARGTPAAARMTVADSLANTSAMPAREIETDKNVATIPQSQFVGSISDAPTEYLQTAPTSTAKIALRAAVAAALLGAVAVAGWKLWPRTPAAAVAGPQQPAPTVPRTGGGGTIGAFVAGLGDLHGLIDAGQLGNAGGALASLAMPDTGDEAAQAVRRVAEARLAAHRGEWDAAEAALGNREDADFPLTVLKTSPADPQLAKSAEGHRALGEMLAVLVAARWPITPLAGQPPEIDAAQAQAIVSGLPAGPEASAMASAEPWASEYLAATALAGDCAQRLIDGMWSAAKPEGATFAALAGLLRAPAEATNWAAALREAVGTEFAEPFRAIEALAVLGGVAPDGTGPKPTDIIRQFAGGERIPTRSDQAERLAILVAEAARGNPGDDLALQAFTRLTEKLLAPSAAVHKARGDLIEKRLWHSIANDPPDRRTALVEQFVDDGWDAKLRAGGEASAGALALLQAFAAEAASHGFDESSPELSAQVRSAADWLGTAALPENITPEAAAYRRYVEAIVDSYSTDEAADVGDRLAAIYAEGQKPPAPLAADERASRAAARLLRCGERIAGLESREAGEINGQLDDVDWSLPAEMPERVLRWLIVAARLAPKPADPAEATKRELLVVLALAGRPETLREAATRAGVLVEQQGLRNTQLLSIMARAALADFEAARAAQGP